MIREHLPRIRLAALVGIYGSDVAGVVLVDASHPDHVEQLERATGRSMTPPRGVLAFGSAVAGTGLPRLMTRDVAPARASRFVHEASAAYAPTSSGFDPST